MPSSAFLPLTALMGSAAIVNAAKFCGALDSNTGQGIWRSWQDFLGVLGIAMLPQVMLLNCTPSSSAACCELSCHCCLQAIWAICSKHHTMLPAAASSLVALTYLFMVPTVASCSAIPASQACVNMTTQAVCECVDQGCQQKSSNMLCIMKD